MLSEKELALYRRKQELELRIFTIKGILTTSRINKLPVYKMIALHGELYFKERELRMLKKEWERDCE